MRRAEHHIMSQTADTEPPRWPIAPDGYIPNSVIRSWKRKGKEFAKMDSCNDNFSALLYVDEASDEDEDEDEDINSRIFWLTDDDEEEEKEETEKEDEKKNKKQKVEKTEVGVKAREDEKKEKKQDKMDRSVLDKQTYDIHDENTLQNQMKPEDGVSTTFSSRKTVNFIPIAIHEIEHQPLRELREDVKLPETIIPPQKYVSVTNKQTPFTSLIKKDDKMDRSVLAKQSYNSSGPPVERSAVSAVTVIPKQELRASLYIPPTEPTNLTSHPLMAPPPSREKPQPQPITDKRFLLSSTKYSNIKKQEQLPLDRKVLDLFKKIKRSSCLGKLSTTAHRPPASKGRHSSVQTNTGRISMKGSEFRSTPSTIQTHSLRNISPECPNHPLCSDYPAQSAQTATAATEHPVTSGQLAATIISHLRVVQNIQTKDTLELDSFHFHHVIPLPSRHSFITSNPCGKTQYGRLQFDWIRESEGDKLLLVSGVKIKHTAHKVSVKTGL